MVAPLLSARISFRDTKMLRWRSSEPEENDPRRLGTFSKSVASSIPRLPSESGEMSKVLYLSRMSQFFAILESEAST